MLAQWSKIKAAERMQERIESRLGCSRMSQERHHSGTSGPSFTRSVRTVLGSGIMDGGVSIAQSTVRSEWVHSLCLTRKAGVN